MRKLLCLWLLVGLMACREEKDDTGLHFAETLEFTEDCSGLVSDYVDSVRYLVLADTGVAGLRQMTKVLFHNGLIYVGDFPSHRIVVFDMTGVPTLVLDKQGRGSGEYLRITDFSVDEKHIYIYEDVGERLLAYGCRDGQYRFQKPVPVRANSIAAMPEGKFLLSYNPAMISKYDDHPPYFLFRVGRDMQIERKWMEYDTTSCEMPPVGFRLEDSGGFVCFSTRLFDGFTLFDKGGDGDCVHVKIDFEHKLSEEERRDPQLYDDAKAYTLLRTPLCTKDYFVFSIGFGSHFDTYLYDRKNRVFCRRYGELLDYYKMPFYPMAVHGDEFVSMVYDDEWYKQSQMGALTKADSATEQALKNGNHVLIFFTMKRP